MTNNFALRNSEKKPLRNYQRAWLSVPPSWHGVWELFSQCADCRASVLLYGHGLVCVAMVAVKFLLHFFKLHSFCFRMKDLDVLIDFSWFHFDRPIKEFWHILCYLFYHWAVSVFLVLLMFVCISNTFPTLWGTWTKEIHFLNFWGYFLTFPAFGEIFLILVMY